MNGKIYILILSTLLIALSCDKWSRDEYPEGGELIYLTAKTDDIISTKVPYDTENGHPTPDNHLNVDVWASTTENKYVHIEGWDGTRDVDANGDGTVSTNERAVSIHTKAFFQSDKPQLLSQAVYPPPAKFENSIVKDPEPVYFIALHPQSTDQKQWTTNNEGTVAQFTFDGSQDLMYAPQVVGKYREGEQVLITETPTLHFYHLLTRFNIKIGADLEGGVRLFDIQNAWGKIVGLTIKQWDSQGWGVNVDNLTIDLTADIGTDTPLTDIAKAVAMGEGDKTKSTNFYKVGEDVVFPSDDGYAIGELQDVAYVMCAPVTATDMYDEYVIIVETQKENQAVKETEIFLNLREYLDKQAGTYQDFTGSSMGREFNITLLFQKTRAIANVVSISPWSTGGQGSGEIKD